MGEHNLRTRQYSSFVGEVCSFFALDTIFSREKDYLMRSHAVFDCLQGSRHRIDGPNAIRCAKIKIQEKKQQTTVVSK